MQGYFTELSRYVIAALMILYALCSFLCLWGRLEKKKLLYGMQNLLMFSMQFFMFGDLILVSRNLEYVIYYVFVQVFLLTMAVMVPMIYERTNRLLLNNMCMMLGLGLCMISRLSFNRAIKQYIIVLASLTICLLIPWLLAKIRFWKKLTWIYGFAGIFLLGIVLVLGEVTRGSKISVTIRDIAFQPTEFVKIIFIFFLAAALWEKTTFLRIVLTAAVAGMHVVILVLSKDLGAAVIFFVGYVFVVFAATRNYLYLLLGAVGGSGASWAAYQLFAHVRTRVLAWRDPWAYIDTKGYAITQSLFAIGSGSWFGMGLLKGNPDAIPLVEQDFTFSAVCEELGVVFGIALIFTILVCFLAMMKMAIQVRDRFYQLVVYGIGIMYIFQVFLTVGGGVKFIPLTGVTLPFISYGGSSAMTTMMMFFLIQGIYIRLQQEKEKHNGAKRSGEKESPRTSETAGDFETAGRAGTAAGSGSSGRARTTGLSRTSDISQTTGASGRKDVLEPTGAGRRTGEPRAAGRAGLSGRQSVSGRAGSSERPEASGTPRTAGRTDAAGTPWPTAGGMEGKDSGKRNH